MLMTNTVLAHICCQVDILRATSAAIREQDHGAGAHSVHVTRNRTGAGPCGPLRRPAGNRQEYSCGAPQERRQLMFQIERAERAKSIASRRLVYGLALLISGCVYFAQHTAQGACASSLDSPIRNFCVVTSQVLWRGERPNKADATWLVQHRVGTIVNLQEIQNDHDAFDAAAATPDLTRSIDYF